MKLNTRISFEMFEGEVIVMAGTQEEIRKAVKKLKVDCLKEERKDKLIQTITSRFQEKKSFGCYIPLCISHQVGMILINTDHGLFKTEEPINLICTVLPHEIRHYVDLMCENIGIKDTETEAYITGYISKLTLPKLISSYYDLTKK